MSSIDIERRKHTRGLILKILASQYPNPVDSLMVRRELTAIGYPIDKQEFAGLVAYLVELGYAQSTAQKVHGITLNRITASGLNLLDQLIESDPGVDIGGLSN